MPNPDKIGLDPRHIPPRGSNHPVLYLVGEAGGFEEAEQRKPFVGVSGKMLDKALGMAVIDPGLVRWGNVVPYRPWGRSEGRTGDFNRQPTEYEIKKFLPELLLDIRATNPKMVVMIGGTALKAFGFRLPISKSRGEIYSGSFVLRGPLFGATWHPSFVLRNGGEKSSAFQDLVSDLAKFWRVSCQGQ